jgi:hypothetical protein
MTRYDKVAQAIIKLVREERVSSVMGSRLVSKVSAIIKDALRKEIRNIPKT